MQKKAPEQKKSSFEEKNVILKKSNSHNINLNDFYLNMIYCILIFYNK